MGYEVQGRRSEIIEKGLENKVLVRWTSNKNKNFEEYSIHSLGIEHEDDNHDLIWGSYYSSKKDAEKDFEYYREDSNLRKLVRNIIDTSNAWEEDDRFKMSHNSSLEYLSIDFGDERDFFFEGEGYTTLENEYKESCVAPFVDFRDYAIWFLQDC